MSISRGRVWRAAAGALAREAAAMVRGLARRETADGGATLLREGDTRLAVVRGGALVAQTSDVALSHAEFVRRSMGALPDGAWVGTVRKARGAVLALNSRTFYGNQLPPPDDVLAAVRAAFR